MEVVLADLEDLAIALVQWIARTHQPIVQEL